nr:hypothetical protein [Tanacetum cinerariifolium]
MASASPICLMAQASSTKSWLWHQRKKQKSISSTKTSSKFKAEITSSSYGFVWTNENCQYKWKANDREDIGKLGAKGDIGFFIGGGSTVVAAGRVRESGVEDRIDREIWSIFGFAGKNPAGKVFRRWSPAASGGQSAVAAAGWGGGGERSI